MCFKGYSKSMVTRWPSYKYLAFYWINDKKFQIKIVGDRIIYKIGNIYFCVKLIVFALMACQPFKKIQDYLYTYYLFQRII